MDLEDFFERIESQFNKTLPFVVYRKPDAETVVAFLQKDGTLYTVSDYTESGFVFAPFDDREAAILIPEKQSEWILASYTEITVYDEKPDLPSMDRSNAKEHHLNLVRKGMAAIDKGELKKVVLSRKEILKHSGAKPTDIFKRLLIHYPTAFVYCFHHPKVGTWLGATPETLLKIEGHRFFTSALAGTQKYAGTTEVGWNTKEKDEQQMVSDYIVGRLKPLVGQIHMEPVETVKAGNLLHLRTNISGTLDFELPSLKQILGTLHPTPAVCGLPMEKAKQFILEHENYRRDYYTGFLGEINLKEKRLPRSKRHNAEHDAFATMLKVTSLFVNLRCMQLNTDGAVIYIGGGITIDSDPEAEWEESVNKSHTIKSVL